MTFFRFLSLFVMVAITVGFYLAQGVPPERVAAANESCPLTWTRVPAPLPVLGLGDLRLQGIDANGSNDVWAVGRTRYPSVFLDQTLTQHWDGTSWTIYPGHNIADMRNNVLNAVAIVAPDAVWAVGSATRDNKPTPNVQLWNGTRWLKIKTPFDVDDVAELVSVDGKATNDVWAVGNASGKALILHWDGSTWTRVPSPVKEPLLRVIAHATDDVWVLGTRAGKRASILHWDGSSWSVFSTLDLIRIPPLDWAIESVNDFVVLGPNDIWLVGNYSSASDGHLARRWHWDGSTWSVAPDPASPVSRVAGTSSNNLWSISGGDSPVLSRWNGSAWTTYELNKEFGPGWLGDITAVSENEFWAVGDSLEGDLPNGALVLHGTMPCLQIPTAQADLVSPVDAAVLTTISPTFDWTDTPEATHYQFRLYQDPRGEPKVVLGIRDSQYDYAAAYALASGTYYWQIESCNYLGCGTPGPMSSFVVDAHPPTTPPNLLAPRKNAKLYNPQYSFEWSEIPNAETYTLHIYDQQQFGSMVREVTLSETQHQLAQLLRPGKYVWRVKGCNEGGCTAWSEQRRLRIKIPNKPRRIAPAPDAVLDSSTVTFRWDASASATFYGFEVRLGDSRGLRIAGRTLLDLTDTVQLHDGNFVWTAWACSGNGCTRKNEWQPFTINSSK